MKRRTAIILTVTLGLRTLRVLGFRAVRMQVRSLNRFTAPMVDTGRRGVTA